MYTKRILLMLWNKSCVKKNNGSDKFFCESEYLFLVYLYFSNFYFIKDVSTCSVIVLLGATIVLSCVCVSMNSSFLITNCTLRHLKISANDSHGHSRIHMFCIHFMNCDALIQSKYCECFLHFASGNKTLLEA